MVTLVTLITLVSLVTRVTLVTLAWFRKHGASDYVLDLLENGVTLDWKPGTDFKKISVTKNNKSAYEHSSFTERRLKEWIAEGSCQIVPKEECAVISPLSVATRYDHKQQKPKLRLCYDGSRMKRHLSFRRIKLPDLEFAKQFIRQNDRIALVDFTNFYFHFR